MFEKMFGASMAAHGFDFFGFKGVEGCRWLMYDEMLGCFTFMLGSPGY